MKLIEMLGRAVFPKLHETFRNYTFVISEHDDDDEEHEPLDQIENIGGLSVIIEYTNTRGESSQRLITCKKLSVRAGREYISAFCHARKAPRSFRIDRIAEVFDANTGECLSPSQTFFAGFKPDEISKSGLSWGLSVRQRADLIALLNALVFIARCDNEFHPAERESLEQALTQFWLRLEIPGDPDFDEILRYADKLAPDGETFWAALHRFREDLKLATLFRRLSNILIQADGAIHERETYWSIEIDEFLSE